MESKSNTNESLYKNKYRHRKQTNLQFPEGVGRERGTNEKYRVNRHTTIDMSNK